MYIGDARVSTHRQHLAHQVDRRIMHGSAAQVEQALAASQSDGVINTASSERLNATFRERLSALTRRGRALARTTRTPE